MTSLTACQAQAENKSQLKGLPPAVHRKQALKAA